MYYEEKRLKTPSTKEPKAGEGYLLIKSEGSNDEQGGMLDVFFDSLNHSLCFPSVGMIVLT